MTFSSEKLKKRLNTGILKIRLIVFMALLFDTILFFCYDYTKWQLILSILYTIFVVVGGFWLESTFKKLIHDLEIKDQKDGQ